MNAAFTSYQRARPARCEQQGVAVGEADDVPGPSVLGIDRPPGRIVPCGRCMVTTTDQVTGERGSQPLKMLGRRRRFGQQLVFGQNLIPDAGGVIRVGDRVEILDAA